MLCFCERHVSSICYTAPVGIKIVLNDDAVLDAVTGLSKQVLGLGTQLTTLKGVLMATLQDVQNEVLSLKAVVSKEAGEVASAVNALKDQIKVLQDQIAAGSGVSAADAISNVSAPPPVTP